MMARATLRFRVVLLAMLVMPGPAMASMPDLERAFAQRDLEPVREWLETMSGADAPREAWRARIAVARIDAPGDAPPMLERALEQYPDDGILLLQQAALARAELDADDGRFERMREARAVGRLIDRALEAAPEHAEALVAAIEFHREVPRIAGGRAERLPELNERLQQLDPARAAFLKARLARAADEFGLAQERIAEAIGRDSLARPGWRVLQSAILGDAGREDEAIEALESLLVDHPEFGPAWFELGRQWARSNRAPGRGIEALERYLLTRPWPEDPSTASALVHLATLKQRAGDFDGAQRALDQARILDPELISEDGAEPLR